MKIVYTKSWNSKPYLYARPFVPLAEYEKLLTKYKALKKTECGKNAGKSQ